MFKNLNIGAIFIDNGVWHFDRHLWRVILVGSSMKDCFKTLTSRLKSFLKSLLIFCRNCFCLELSLVGFNEPLEWAFKLASSGILFTYAWPHLLFAWVDLAPLDHLLNLPRASLCCLTLHSTLLEQASPLMNQMLKCTSCISSLSKKKCTSCFLISTSRSIAKFEPHKARSSKPLKK